MDYKWASRRFGRGAVLICLGLWLTGRGAMRAAAQAWHTSPPLHTVFIITLENARWSEVLGSSEMPYLNNTLLPQSSYANQNYAAPNIHPSLPNYLWMEAGQNFGITEDLMPSEQQWSAPHLVTAAEKAGYGWKAWVENIDGKSCPLTSSGLYTPAVNPTVYFTDVTGWDDPNNATCIAHERPFTELAAALANNRVPNINWIVPNLCDDGHSCSWRTADQWLQNLIPKIMASQAYQQGGVIFLTWDEVDTPYQNVPVGLIVLSPAAKGGGYSSSIYYTHASMLRTIEEIFGITPYFGNAANATDLSDLFRTAAISLDPSTLDFGSQAADATSPAQTVTLTNSGGAGVRIQSIQTSGPFQESDTCPSTLAAGSSCTIAVVYAPTGPGTDSGTLTVTDADPGSPQTVTLSGQSLEGEAALSAHSFDFGRQADGSTSASQTLAVSNSGNANLNLRAVAVSGPFLIDNQCPRTLAGGHGCVINIRFAPDAPGAAHGTLTLADSAADSPQKVVLSGTGEGAIAIVSTESLSFPDTGEGAQSAPMTVSLNNSGNVALTLTGIHLSGPFAESDNCGSSLSAQSTCAIQVTFSPPGVGTDSGTLTLADNAPDSPQRVSLQGTGRGALAQLAPASLDFGLQAVGTASAPLTATLSNGGNAALVVQSIHVGSPFLETDNCTGAVGPGADCQIRITFRPGQNGTASDTLSVADNAPDSPQTVALSGDGQTYSLTLAPTTLDFGGVPVGQSSAAQMVTATNTGTAALTLDGITAGGAFKAASQCGAQLAAGASCTVSVTFAPTVGGGSGGTLSLADNAPGSPQSVALSGNGQTYSVTLAPAALDFGGVPVGQSSAAQTVTVTNSGNTALTLGGVTVSGPFTVSNQCGAQLAAGASCTVAVTFSPESIDPASGRVTLTDNAPDSPQTVALSGQGEAPKLAVSATALTFGEELVGATTAAQTVQVSNAGNLPLTLAPAALNGEYSEASDCGTTLAPGTDCTLQVRFAPTTTGEDDGTLALSSNGGHAAVAVSGAGGDFTIGVAAGPASGMYASGPAALQTQATVPVVIASVAGFADPHLAVTCATASAAAGCTVTPAVVNLSNSTPAATELVVSLAPAPGTGVAFGGPMRGTRPRPWWPLPLGGVLLGIGAAAALGRMRRGLVALLLGAALIAAGCGGVGPSAVAYSVQITATASAGGSRSTSVVVWLR